MRKIKLLFTFLAVSALMGVIPSVSAQEQIKTVKYNGQSTKFAFLVTNAMQFQGAVATAEQMDVQKNNFSYEIVVAGKLAQELAENEELTKEIDKSQKLGVKIVVCEGALAYFNVPKSKLDKRLFTTPNGWIYMFELNDKGYNTLSL